MSAQQTILDNGQGTTELYCYNSFEQVTNLYEYGFQSEGPYPGNPSCVSSSGLNASALGLLRRQTTTAYHAFSAGTHIVNSPDSVTVADGSGNTVKQTTYTYTDTVQSSGTTVGLVAPPGANRGNIASISKLVSTGNNLTTSYTYFDNGNLQSMIDGCGNTVCPDMTGANHTTTYSYTDNFTVGSAPGQTNAYLTQVTYPNTGVAHAESFSWGYIDSKMRSLTDQNSQTTNFQYNDPLVRLTQISSPDGGSKTVTYNDSTFSSSANTPNYTVTQSVNASVSKTIQTAFDGIGHTVRTLLTTDPDGTDITDTTYDGVGRVYKKSNPYRAGSSTTDGTTTFNYDALGRAWNIGEPDGSSKNFQFSGSCTTAWDEASKVHGECTDGLGRLTQLWEDQPGLNYGTFYNYDTLDNMTCVEQHGSASTGTGCSSAPSNDPTSPWRIRRFSYDSLSRLLTGSNPESGTITYAYDANGNVASKIAPQPNQTGSATVTTNYNYDVLNRITTKTYVGMSTTAPKYGYDGVAPSGCTPPTLTDKLPTWRADIDVRRLWCNVLVARQDREDT
jgi:YD repeat-containing protein